MSAVKLPKVRGFAATGNRCVCLMLDLDEPLPPLSAIGAIDYSRMFTSLDLVLADAAWRKANDEADARPLPVPSVATLVDGGVAGIAGYCLKRIAHHGDTVADSGQRAAAAQLFKEVALEAVLFLKRRGKRGDMGALAHLDLLGVAVASCIQEIAASNPELAKAYYRNEVQMPYAVSRDRSVTADAEALMRAVELGEAHVIRVAPKSKRPPATRKTGATATGKRKGKRGPNHDSMVIQLMRPVFAHAMMLRSPGTCLAEPVPPAVAALIALPPLAPESIKRWVDALYVWMEYLDKGHALEHPVLRQLGMPFVPDEIARPARANGFFKITRRHRGESPERSFIKKGVKRRMGEWLRMHIRATENPTV